MGGIFLSKKISSVKLTRKGLRKIKNLSSKEKLFCTYYSISRNGKEAATKSGYVFPEKSAAKLLKKQAVQEEIRRNDALKKPDRNDVISGYYRLAFGCFADAVSLLFDDEMTAEKIQQMDLFNISEIKRKKNGEVEIKFFDRLKALEKLENTSCDKGENGIYSLYSAIEKGACALKGEKDE